MPLFYYQREVTKKVPVENPEEGKPKEQEVKEIVWDCFNVEKVIRGHWTSDTEFTIFFDDGHEQAEDVRKPKYNAKGVMVGFEERRERGWYMSQIILNKEDAERLRRTSDWGGTV